MKELIINLDAPPSERWSVLRKYKKEVNDLIGFYLADLGDADFFEGVIDWYKEQFIAPSYQEEARSIAAMSTFSENQILMANLYYDALKLVFGCTSFAVETEGSIFHARNLDWWSERNALKNYSSIFHFQKGQKTIYSTVGWPGFIGALSGMRHHAYSITLNAVMSEESPHFALPITFLIRDVLEQQTSFEQALKVLSETPIANDCLLMLVGRKKGEMAVIERTPTQNAIRKSDTSYLIVTNDYKKLNGKTIAGDLLQTTSCGRYDRVEAILNERKPTKESDYFAILSDKAVKMEITMQQMLFNLTENRIMVK